MRKLKFICVALVIFMLTSCGLNPGSDAKYLDAEHDVIIYEGSEYLLADGYVIHSRHLDYPSGNSADLVDYDQDKLSLLDSIVGGFGTFVFYSKNKTILYVMDEDRDKYYIRSDKFDYYISLLDGEEPPVYYIKSEMTRTISLLDEEQCDVIGDVLYGDAEALPYDAYISSAGFNPVGKLNGGEDDWEFYCSEYELYYSDEFGFGITKAQGKSVYIIPREYDSLFEFSLSDSDVTAEETN